MISLILAIAMAPPANELESYVFQRDPATKWVVERHSSVGTTSIRLTSQRWHGFDWTHPLTINHPGKLRNKGIAMLCITGDKTGNSDEIEASKIATRAGMPVATLYNVPNQPIFGAKEDALIAITFQKYFETKDATWPLLFPMTKSAIEAMNAIQDSTKKSSNPIKKFVIFGGSKRGWTTWLAAGTGDKRIAGISPVVFDNLNLIKQVDRQKSMMGDYSPMIKDYVNSGMMDAIKTPLGRQLAAMIDPLTYVKKASMPKLIINGANDMFWAPGASSLYYDQLVGPKSMLVVPNEGHGLGDRKWMREALGDFGDQVARNSAYPTLQRRGLIGAGGAYSTTYELIGASTAKFTVYEKRVDSWNAMNGNWRIARSKSGKTWTSHSVRNPESGIACYFAVAEIQSRNGVLRVSAPMLYLFPLK